LSDEVAILTLSFASAVSLGLALLLGCGFELATNWALA
jgi:hypothetical protein